MSKNLRNNKRTRLKIVIHRKCMYSIRALSVTGWILWLFFKALLATSCSPIKSVPRLNFNVWRKHYLYRNTSWENKTKEQIVLKLFLIQITKMRFSVKQVSVISGYRWVFSPVLISLNVLFYLFLFFPTILVSKTEFLIKFCTFKQHFDRQRVWHDTTAQIDNVFLSKIFQSKSMIIATMTRIRPET